MLKTEHKKAMSDTNQDTAPIHHEAILKADLNNQIVRKVRAQTLFDGMARELTPLISKAISIINPNKNEYHPDESIRATGSLVIGTNLNTTSPVNNSYATGDVTGTSGAGGSGGSATYQRLDDGAPTGEGQVMVPALILE